MPPINQWLSYKRAAPTDTALPQIVRVAFWLGLGVIAVVVTASYILLQQLIAEQHRDQSLHTLASSQKALSQRIVILAFNAQQGSVETLPAAINALHSATIDFEKNYDQILKLTGAESTIRHGENSLNTILFSDPIHLDHFTLNLAANAHRFVSYTQSALANDSRYLANSGLAALDDTIASQTLYGYAALQQMLATDFEQRIENMLTLNRFLYGGTIVMLILIGLLVFRPMMRVMERHTKELLQARSSMAYLASHDGLTGLHNRTFLKEQFSSMLANVQRRGTQLALVHLDLDHFKQINDQHGHAAGDHVLSEVARRIRTTTRGNDLCVRLGGDEFVLIFSEAEKLSNVSNMIGRVLAQISKPIVDRNQTILPGASAGVALFPLDAKGLDDLMASADLALYSAKKSSRGTFRFFSTDLRQAVDRQQQLEKELRGAIHERAFASYFQPQVNLKNGELCGVEALARWPDEQRGLMSPGDFLPTAEKAGLMPAIGQILTEKAIEQAASWYKAGIPFGRLAVNVSESEINCASFSDFILDTLARHGLPPHLLSIEIVESVILDDLQNGMINKLTDLRARGIHLELDDFGTGYASLTHIDPEGIDRIKIDRQFIRNIHESKRNCSVVKALVDLSSDLGIGLVAEGAETQAEMDMLMTLGCPAVQGYGIAQPMSADLFSAWLEGRSSRSKMTLTV
ncbi:putative bifunctional diguanylate cyclase/phosphodiesterase [Limoniibacter endophyticus]|nr:EAL domain-containing protein [Limoniibacter endophyticus]